MKTMCHLGTTLSWMKREGDKVLDEEDID